MINKKGFEQPVNIIAEYWEETPLKLKDAFKSSLADKIDYVMRLMALGGIKKLEIRFNTEKEEHKYREWLKEMEQKGIVKE